MQGPSAEDWQKACDEFGGEEAVLVRRKHEEGYDDSLGIDQWASYEDEQHVSLLIHSHERKVADRLCRSSSSLPG